MARSFQRGRRAGKWRQRSIEDVEIDEARARHDAQSQPLESSPTGACAWFVGPILNFRPPHYSQEFLDAIHEQIPRTYRKGVKKGRTFIWQFLAPCHERALDLARTAYPDYPIQILAGDRMESPSAFEASASNPSDPQRS